ISQPIDHNGPWSSTIFYNGQVQVRTSTPISVLVKDKYGNPVDDRNVVERVKFDASSKGVSGFQSGASWVKSLTVPVNASGYATVQYLVDPLGTNYVYIDPPSPLWTKLISILGISQARPSSVSSVISPTGTPYPYTAVKTGQFSIGFTFYDQYGYPTMNQPVMISTSVPGESMNLTTNKNGMVIITYGPKDIAGVYTITAMAVNNKSVSVSPKVEFVAGTASDALLTASPLTMASRDVKDDITSTLIMRVMDTKGNPVEGEQVKFRFKSFSVSALTNQTIAPVLENGVASTSSLGTDITAVTDAFGEAIVTFHPGAFTTDYFAPGYNTTAKASADVEAQWSTKTRKVTLGYLNYPYLTIQSWVNPTTVRVNETVDIMVKVTGDGWALQPKPIDVVLVTDRSGSMFYDLPDREVSVMGASTVFATKLEFSRDRLGQVSFGGKGKTDYDCYLNGAPGIDDDCGGDDVAYATAHYNMAANYADYATADQLLTSTPGQINTAISSIAPGGNTPMRYAIYKAIYDNRNRWNPKSIRAIILLSDGDYNHYGDPFAKDSSKSTTSTNTGDYSDLTAKWYKFSGMTNASDQNMVNFAKLYNVKIFSIGFASSISSGGKTALSNLATQTGGKYYDATAANLADVYSDIAGSLKDTAGVNTVMNLSFKNIAVTNNITPGNQVYDYVFIDGHSTLVDSWNATMAHLPGYPVTSNSTSEWKTNLGVNFNIGTVKLGQVWQSTITLKVLKDGNINVFDPASKVGIQDSTFPLKIPDAYFTALPNNSANTLLGPKQVSIDDLELTNAGSLTTADVKWNLTYNGMYPITEDIMITEFGSSNHWIHIAPQEVSNVTTSDTGSIPIVGYGEGYYTIRVDVDAYDAEMTDTETLDIYLSGAGIRPLNPGEVPVIGVGATPTPKPRIKIT
ncbi:MAG: hypothetical protein LUO97_07140, partial [Methanomicrobiales archaeon]|nr:hypothetical protein [Methanomicrobiales archaeon]